MEEEPERGVPVYTRYEGKQTIAWIAITGDCWVTANGTQPVDEWAYIPEMEAATSAWIPVEGGLPSKHETVLVQNESGNIYTCRLSNPDGANIIAYAHIYPYEPPIDRTWGWRDASKELPRAGEVVLVRTITAECVVCQHLNGEWVVPIDEGRRVRPTAWTYIEDEE